MKKIMITKQGVAGGNIAAPKPVGFVALNFDNMKVTIDAFQGSGFGYMPREKCKIEIVDQKEVFELNSDTLLDMVRFFCAYAEEKDKVVRFPNKYHYIVPDDTKQG
jgi:hypothetical protein